MAVRIGIASLKPCSNVLELLVLNHEVSIGIASFKPCSNMSELRFQYGMKWIPHRTLFLILWSGQIQIRCHVILVNVILNLTYTTVGVTFQHDCRFTSRVKNKLVKGNKCFQVLRLLHKEVCIVKQKSTTFLTALLCYPISPMGYQYMVQLILN